jgi:uncharacterized membrane protein YdjX (TVP38/TMEM64 family)
MQPMLHAFLGISRISFGAHFWGSAVGYVVPIVAISWFGEKLFEALRDSPSSVWAGLGVTAIVVFVVFRFISARSRSE